MRIERVVTNRRCNQNCSFCTERSAVDDRAFVHPVSVLRRVEEAVRGGAEEIVLTGGEPTLRRDLVEIVRRVRALGARVVLETNATAVEDARALVDAGVGRVRVHLPAWGAACDEVTRDPGGFEATLRGLSAFAETSCAIEIAVPIVRASREHVREIPPRIAELFPNRIRTLVLHVPEQSPDPAALLSFAEAVPVILEVEAAARRVGIAVKLAPDAAPPPCMFPARTRPSHLWSMSGRATYREGRDHVEACGRCIVRERCSGLPTHERHAAIEPIVEDRVRRRLSLISTVEEQIARELVSKSLGERAGRVVDEEIVRVNFHCNQVCSFCFVSTHLPPPAEELVSAAIESAAARGVRVILSGGEPTLNPRLAEYVRLAANKSAHPVEVQTNAVRLDDAALAKSLVEAGMREAFVSLHGSTAAVGDAVTNAPGTFERSLRGIDNLHALGVTVRLNFVICRRNAFELPALVELAAARWPGAFVNVSFVAPSTDVVPRDADLVPRYDEVLPHVARAVERAKELSVPIGGFESMCGIPLCLVPAPLDPFFALSTLPPGYDEGEFVKTSSCGRCALSTRCHGIRRGYLELHGDGELRPVS